MKTARNQDDLVMKAGEKRKNSIQKVNQPNQRKRRKLAFETLPEDWGEIGVDIGRMEMKVKPERCS